MEVGQEDEVRLRVVVEDGAMRAEVFKGWWSGRRGIKVG